MKAYVVISMDDLLEGDPDPFCDVSDDVDYPSKVTTDKSIAEMRCAFLNRKYHASPNGFKLVEFDI